MSGRQAQRVRTKPITITAMLADPPDIPPEALEAARRKVEALHEQLAALAAGLTLDTPMAADLAEESES